MLKRTVNAIRIDIKGKMAAYLELKKKELKEAGIKKGTVRKKINELKAEINKLKPKVRDNKCSDKELIFYKKNKISLYYKQNKLNKINFRIKKLQNIIKNKIYSIGFGSKKMFRKQYLLKENNYKSHEKWYNDYLKARDKNIFYLGSGDESAGNQLCQLQYSKETDEFTLKLRKEKNYSLEKENYLYIKNVNFKYMGDLIKQKIIQGGEALSYRFHRINNKWYFQCMFSISFEDYSTRSSYGVIGLDYNDGFIELSETSEDGNLINLKHYPLDFHGTGNKAKNEIRNVVKDIAEYALTKGKDIVIEELDFVEAKAGAEKGKNEYEKNFNRMLHAFDYHRYIETMENCCHRKRINLIKVNPCNTSKIGKEKYSGFKKLTVHQAASYVIARRGQGFKDKLKTA